MATSVLPPVYTWSNIVKITRQMLIRSKTQQQKCFSQVILAEYFVFEMHHALQLTVTEKILRIIFVDLQEFLHTVLRLKNM